MYKKQCNKHIDVFIDLSRQPVLRAVAKVKRTARNVLLPLAAGGGGGGWCPHHQQGMTQWLQTLRSSLRIGMTHAACLCFNAKGKGGLGSDAVCFPAAGTLKGVLC